MKSSVKSTVIYSLDLPERSHFANETVLFYDSVLAKNKALTPWLKSFEHKIALKSGEQLKTLDSLKSVLGKISASEVPKSTNLTFVSVGGGSVGDFVGFVASIYMRGRRLVQIPSTWLSAVDSAHGGKNGLNLNKTKNQIGTFYPAHEIFISKKILLTQPEARLKESMGEIIKIAVLSDKKLFQYLEDNVDNLQADNIFSKLSQIISLKYKIVSQDPLEKKGLRRLLNLGHTMGHVFEASFGLPHGVAVLLGMKFSARWSFHKKLLTEKEFVRISQLIDSLNLDTNLSLVLKNTKIDQVKKLLLYDKKLTSSTSMDFIFINSIGKCVRTSVCVQDILSEVKRQKQEY
jgi:3-dehydroquinate synthase